MESFEKLKEAKNLLDQGVINEEEFQKLKDRLLSEMDNEQSTQSTNVNQSTTAVTPSTDGASAVTGGSEEGASTGMKVLSFLIPLAGLILFIVDKDKKPAVAKDELMWAGIGFGVGIVLYIIAVGTTASYYY